VLEVRGTFSDAEEPLLLNSVILAVLYEREQLKALYT
jgi:hypothetical protein